LEKAGLHGINILAMEWMKHSKKSWANNDGKY
jgi:hypothetical protein